MNGQPFGAIIPTYGQQSPQDTYAMLQQQEEQKKYREELQKQRQEQENSQKIKYLADSLDFNSHATGTDYDEIVRNSLEDGIKEGSAAIMSGQMSWPQLQLLISQRARDLAQYSGTAKTIDAQLKEQAAQLAKESGIDANAAYKYAKLHAFHNEDGSLKPIGEVNPNQPYLTEAMMKFAPYISKGPDAINGLIKGADKRVISPQVVSDTNGVKKVRGYQGEYYPQFNDLIDEKGNVIKEGSNEIPVAVRLKTPEDLYRHATSTLGGKMWVAAQLKANGIDPSDDRADEAGKQLVFNYFKQKGVGYLAPMKNEEDRSQQYAIQARREDRNSKTTAEPTSEINDAYSEIKSAFNRRESMPLSELSAQTQTIILNYANKLSGKGGLFSSGVTQDDIILKQTASGGVSIWKGNKAIAPLTMKDANLPAQVNAKAKTAVVNKSNQTSKKKDPLGLGL